jgi:hypothetical protein
VPDSHPFGGVARSDVVPYRCQATDLRTGNVRGRSPYSLADGFERSKLVEQAEVAAIDSGPMALRRSLKTDAKGDPEVVLAPTERQLRWLIRIFGLHGGPTTMTRGQVAKALEVLDRWDEARLLREDMLSTLKVTREPEHPETLIIESYLAINLRHVSRMDEAITLGAHVLECRRRVLGPDHPDTNSAQPFLNSIN